MISISGGNERCCLIKGARQRVGSLVSTVATLEHAVCLISDTVSLPSQPSGSNTPITCSEDVFLRRGTRQKGDVSHVKNGCEFVKALIDHGHCNGVGKLDNDKGSQAGK